MDPSHPVDFGTVLREELAQIDERRKLVSREYHTAYSAPQTEAGDDEHEMRTAAFRQNLVGLALSGGGIRSATFNLGFLQGLARRDLLRQIDYLSTVSGGGYIGSWLTAWIYRDGSLRNVEFLLDANRREHAEADRPEPAGTASAALYHPDRDDKGSERKRHYVTDDEPEPVHHLRSYSNYLTPRLGLFSSDTWVLVTIYLRNLLLNLTVLAAAVLLLLLAVRLCVQAFVAAAGHVAAQDAWLGRDRWAVWLTVTCTAMSALAMWQGYASKRPAAICTGCGLLLGAAFAAFAAAMLMLLGCGGSPGLTPLWPSRDPVETPPGWLMIVALFSVLLGAAAKWFEVFLFVVALIPVLALLDYSEPAFFRESGWTASHPEGLLRALLAAAFFLLVFVLIRIDGSLYQVLRGEVGEKEAPEFRVDLRKLNRGMLVPLLVFGIVISWCALWPGDVWREAVPVEVCQFRWSSAGWFASLFVAVELGIIGHLLYEQRQRRRQGNGAGAGRRDNRQSTPPKSLVERFLTNAVWPVTAIVVGAAWGTALYGLICLLHRWGCSGPIGGFAPLASGPFLVATAGPPLVLLLFVLGAFLMVGLAGDEYQAAYREWWASLCGWILIYGTLWLMVLGVSLYGPALCLTPWWHPWVKWLVGSTWLGTAIGGVLAGRSSKTDGGTRNRLLEGLALIAPHVVLIGLLVLLSLLVQFLLVRDVTAADYWPQMKETMVRAIVGWACVAGLAVLLFTWRIDVNTFSLHEMYANRLIRCYLGASRRKPDTETRAPIRSDKPARVRTPDTITGFDPNDDLPLSSFRSREKEFAGPLPVITTALNLVQGDELAWQERKAEAFSLTPLYCGSRSTEYRDTRDYAGGLTLGTAVTISGAAVSPNMGYHSSPAVTALLTVFNLRLGAWLGNPRRKTWTKAGPGLALHLFKELFGRTNADSRHVYLSDGGHFDNLGVYELIRRRCRCIVACDAGADPNFALDDLGSLIRKVRTDFGVRIELDTQPLCPEKSSHHSAAHVAVGAIRYDDVDGVAPCGGRGIFIYVRPTLTGDEPSDILNYVTGHSEFPHEPTIDQFYSESQFESYRMLGQHIGRNVAGTIVGTLKSLNS